MVGDGLTRARWSARKLMARLRRTGGRSQRRRTLLGFVEKASGNA
jgi:hypothetical protein